MSNDNDAWARAREAEADYCALAASLVSTDEALARIDKFITALFTCIPGGQQNDTPGARHRRIRAWLHEHFPDLPPDRLSELAWMISEPLDDATRRALRLWVELRFGTRQRGRRR